MPRRVTLTDRQRDALLRLPVDQGELLRHYTLSDEDLGHIRQRRRAHNRFGFALQLCVLRYPGRVLAPGELIPAQVSDFIAAQLGLTSDDLLPMPRAETRHEHLADLRRIYGYRSFSGRAHGIYANGSLGKPRRRHRMRILPVASLRSVAAPARSFPAPRRSSAFAPMRWLRPSAELRIVSPIASRQP
jgi:TnpA family transposase